MLCLFVDADHLLLTGMQEIKDTLRNMQRVQQIILEKLDSNMEETDLPEFIQLPLKTMENIDEIECHLRDSAVAKRLVGL